MTLVETFAKKKNVKKYKEKIYCVLNAGCIVWITGIEVHEINVFTSVC